MSEDDPGAVLQRAQALHERGEYLAAAELYAGLLAGDANLPQVLRTIGLDAVRQGQAEDGLTLIARALELAPQDAKGAEAEATAHLEIGDAVRARAAARRALALHGQSAAAHEILGLASIILDQPDAAVEALTRALELGPASARLHNALAQALRDGGRVEEAIEHCRAAVALAPDDAASHVHLAEGLLLKGDDAEGWREYEWRLRLPGFDAAAPTAPPWDGRPAPDRTLLVTAEQGFGDTLQFCRFATLAAARVGNLVLAVPPALKSLCRSLAGPAAVISSGDEMPSHDVHVSLLSLPGLLGGAAAAPVPPYLAPGAGAREQGRAWIAAGPGRKVGLVWRGRPGHAAERGRSPGLAAFAPLWDVANTRFVGLQKDHDGAELAASGPAAGLLDLGGRLDDFESTAGILSHLDVLITTDTAAAHLAGALGVPVWVALRHSPDWRWLRDRPDSPWYPSARLYRQTAPGDWSGPFEAMARDLAGLTTNS